jgi:hypothetical protein
VPCIFFSPALAFFTEAEFLFAFLIEAEFLFVFLIEAKGTSWSTLHPAILHCRGRTRHGSRGEIVKRSKLEESQGLISSGHTSLNFRVGQPVAQDRLADQGLRKRVLRIATNLTTVRRSAEVDPALLEVTQEEGQTVHAALIGTTTLRDGQTALVVPGGMRVSIGDGITLVVLVGMRGLADNRTALVALLGGIRILADDRITPEVLVGIATVPGSDWNAPVVLGGTITFASDRNVLIVFTRMTTIAQNQR